MDEEKQRQSRILRWLGGRKFVFGLLLFLGAALLVLFGDGFLPTNVERMEALLKWGVILASVAFGLTTGAISVEDVVKVFKLPALLLAGKGGKDKPK